MPPGPCSRPCVERQVARPYECRSRRSHSQHTAVADLGLLQPVVGAIQRLASPPSEGVTVPQRRRRILWAGLRARERRSKRSEQQHRSRQRHPSVRRSARTRPHCPLSPPLRSAALPHHPSPRGGAARESAAPSQRVSTCLRAGSSTRVLRRSYGNLLLELLAQLDSCPRARRCAHNRTVNHDTLCWASLDSCGAACLRACHCCFDCCCHGSQVAQHGASVRSMQLPRP